MTTRVAGPAPMVSVDGVSRRFGARVALADVGFTVGAGELCGLVGGNGAGKTTLARILAGFLDPDAGRVMIAGVDVATAPQAAAARRGCLVEGAPLPPELGAREYLRWRARLRGVEVDVDAALREVGLLDRARDAIATLSKGQRQRVAWAEACLGAPPVLLLDEPAAGLDEEERAAVRARLTAGRGARAVVWASHELADVEAAADRVVVLVAGRVAGAGTMVELRDAAGLAADASLRAVVAALGAQA
ncbi:MAG: ABC transporter ATP-binding protein [Myxococcales bacterium]|nr:ABC transporter ATP-binding protein [Myxococcales bacterium]